MSHSVYGLVELGRVGADLINSLTCSDSLEQSAIEISCSFTEMSTQPSQLPLISLSISPDSLHLSGRPISPLLKDLCIPSYSIPLFPLFLHSHFLPPSWSCSPTRKLLELSGIPSSAARVHLVQISFPSERTRRF